MRNLSIKLVLIFAQLICLLIYKPTFSKEPDIKEIIRMAELQQQKILDNINDVTFIGKTNYKEVEKDGEIKKDIIIQRRVYMKKPGKRHDEYLSMTVNGKQLSKEEMEKEIESWKKRSKAQESKMPLTPEGKDAYNFKLIGEKVINSIQVWIVEFIAKQKDDGYVNGKLYISKNDYNIIRTEFSPVKLPSIIKGLDLVLTYSEVQGYWLPVKFEMDMKINVKFVLNMYYKHIKIEDVYFQHKFNSQLEDSLFES